MEIVEIESRQPWNYVPLQMTHCSNRSILDCNVLNDARHDELTMPKGNGKGLYCRSVV